eukprot:jgi/Mesvir1/16948/Mv15799-RA.1
MTDAREDAQVATADGEEEDWEALLNEDVSNLKLTPAAGAIKSDAKKPSQESPQRAVKPRGRGAATYGTEGSLLYSEGRSHDFGEPVEEGREEVEGRDSIPDDAPVRPRPATSTVVAKRLLAASLKEAGMAPTREEGATLRKQQEDRRAARAARNAELAAVWDK